MSKEKVENDSVLKNSLFLKLFGIPSICFILLELLIMDVPNEDGTLTTWPEFFKETISIVIIWFIISFVIALIIDEVKKIKPKTKIIKEVQYINKPEDKIVVKSDEVIEESEQDEVKKESKKKLSDKFLFKCESMTDAYEYKKMAKYFPKRMYWVFVTGRSFINILLTAIILIILESRLPTLIFFIAFQIYILIYCKVKLEDISEKVFNIRNEDGVQEINFENEFYEDYFIRKAKKISYTINYSEISSFIENDANFYLEYPLRNMVVILQKNKCDLELIDFIRNKFKDLENHPSNTYSYKENKKTIKTNLIKSFMIILFIANLCCLWGALWSLSLVNELNPQHGFNFTKNTWIFWCWLPLPLLSIILGFKFNKAGLKCTKNIVVGFIMGLLLLLYGSFCLFPTFSEDYSKIDSYRDIVGIELPNNGELEIQNWGESFDEDKTKYTIINAYYYNENVNGLVNSIENNNNWILSKKIKSELKILVPSQLRSDNDAYFSIYNKTTNQYNTLPETAGNYEVYAMKYDKSDKQLEIHKFNYSYK